MTKLVGWAIVHSLWQGGVIALVTAALLAATRSSKPSVRYNITITALGLMLALPIATASLTRNAFNDSGVSPDTPTVTTFAVASESPALSPSPSPTLDVSSPVTGSADAGFTIPFIDNVLPWLVAAWIVGLLLASVRLIGGFTKTRRITRQSTGSASRALVIRVEKLCDRLGITRAIRTFESSSIEVPLVIGAIRPVIVVPASLITGLTPLQLDMLLAHELAHIRRNDYLVNLIQTVIETLLFYHPAARWISDRAREEREHCCDDIAIAACGGDAGQYTTTLLVLEESRGEGFGLAAAATGGSLLRRAERIITGRNPYVELGPRWIAGVVTIGAALFTGSDAFAGIQASLTPSVVVAQDSTEKRRNLPDASRAAPS